MKRRGLAHCNKIEAMFLEDVVKLGDTEKNKEVFKLAKPLLVITLQSFKAHKQLSLRA